jgi:hypothetical protein
MYRNGTDIPAWEVIVPTILPVALIAEGATATNPAGDGIGTENPELPFGELGVQMKA